MTKCKENERLVHLKNRARDSGLTLDLHSIEQMRTLLSLNDHQRDALVDLVRTHDEQLAFFINAMVIEND